MPSGSPAHDFCATHAPRATLPQLDALIAPQPSSLHSRYCIHYAPISRSPSNKRLSDSPPSARRQNAHRGARSGLTRRAAAPSHLKRSICSADGSFKYRGAVNAVGALDDAAAALGVVAHSSGNHESSSRRARPRWRSPSHAASLRSSRRQHGAIRRDGRQMRADVSRPNVDGIRGGRTYGGAAFVHPYDDPLVLSGQGTIGLELLDQLDDLDAVLVPVSGGGMIGGIALAIKSHQTGGACHRMRTVYGKGLAGCLKSGVRVAENADAALEVADAIRTKASF